ncbi:hypothetical protein [Wolbachia pipientis]|uniref:hypothetical protein n=1 Tax=Wolbachia pipientis TaxID=955 RepID=UPI0015F843A5|nr:hypothetical protein [Wolbachia pipientis]
MICSDYCKKSYKSFLQRITISKENTSMHTGDRWCNFVNSYAYRRNNKLFLHHKVINGPV